MASIDAQEQLTKEIIGSNAREYNAVNFKSLKIYRDIFKTVTFKKGRLLPYLCTARVFLGNT